MNSIGLRLGWAIKILTTVSVLVLYPGIAQSDSVASLLGNYSISQFARINIDADAIHIDYVVDMAALPALRALHKADANGDGSTSTAERKTYLATLTPEFMRQLHVRVDGKPVRLRAQSLNSSLPPEQSGFSLRIDNRFVADLPKAAGSPAQRLTIENGNYANRFGWHEMVVTSAPGISVYDTNAVSTSATEDLSKNPQTLPPDGPLNERQVHLAFVRGPAPAGALALGPRPGHPPGSAMAGGVSDQPPGMAPLAPGFGGAWLVNAMNRLARMLSRPTLPPTVFVLALLAATALGALHAFSPGHGKTVVGAYLIGSRGTPRHAVFLGLAVTITHTLGVFALGLATLFASHYFVPEKVFPVLSFVSGLLVVVIGVIMFRQRWQAARTPAHGHQRGHAHADHDHHHHHGHDHGHVHAPHQPAALLHSHGGVEHTHLPPGAEGEKITWRSLLTLGISGGLVPCPSALVLLLAAVAVHRIAAGLILVVAFSVGLAVTLTLVGLLFLHARDFFKGSVRSNRVLQVLPVASAALVTGIGAVICYGAILSAV